jgi:hypothetical protein
MRKPLALLLLALVAACGRTADRGDTTAAGTDTSGMSGMAGTMSGAMMDSMAAHMRSMDTAGAPAIQAMLPMHRQMAANMIAQMNSEMRGMNMQAGARWSALMDSVRQDLVRMPEMNAQQLKAFMPAHHGRLTRLMQSHRDMMKM